MVEAQRQNAWLSTLKVERFWDAHAEGPPIGIAWDGTQPYLCCEVPSQVDADAVKEALHSWLQNDEAEILVYNDSVIALSCGTGGPSSGCVLIIGTGTIALGIGPDGEHVRASGWGPAFLDGGSGYDIGQRALAAVARAADGRGPRTELVAATCRHCGVERAEDLLGWAYSEPGWARIAALAPAVLQCAEEGDSVAFRIVTGAANEAVRAAVTIAERSRLKGHRFKLVLSGGLLSEDSPFLDVVREGLKLALPSAEVVHPRVQPAHGAALLIQDRLFGNVAAGGNGGDGAGVSGLFRTPERPRHHHHRRTPSSQDKLQVKAAKFLPLVGLARSKQDPINPVHMLCTLTFTGKKSRTSEWWDQLRTHRRAVSTMDEVFAAASGDPGFERGHDQGSRDIYSSSPAGLEALSLSDSPIPPSPRRGHRRTGSR
ncbi:hypothetical protein WJX75_005370 [Coccomyxa subellipsoidea]|uniref:N-acetyl-D-glucosamine kinase n=1 Tax=Coccomyxa subellipsoidea TaxID=248742 RepID=A0ABR2YW26_9CHLO